MSSTDKKKYSKLGDLMDLIRKITNLPIDKLDNSNATLSSIHNAIRIGCPWMQYKDCTYSKNGKTYVVRKYPRYIFEKMVNNPDGIAEGLYKFKKAINDYVEPIPHFFPKNVKAEMYTVPKQTSDKKEEPWDETNMDYVRMQLDQHINDSKTPRKITISESQLKKIIKLERNGFTKKS